MPNLFYCHNCYNLFSVSGAEQKCTYCSCEIIEEIQEEFQQEEVIETDGVKTPIMESSALNMDTKQFMIAQTEIISSSSPDQPNLAGSCITFLQPPISAVHSIKFNLHQTVSTSAPMTFNRNISSEIHDHHSSGDESPTNKSPNSFPQNRSFFQISARLPELFRPKSKIDKLINKVSLQSTNYSTRDLCSICLKNYQSKDYVRITQCGHKYHEVCLKSWAKVKKECPMCRSQFKL